MDPNQDPFEAHRHARGTDAAADAAAWVADVTDLFTRLTSEAGRRWSDRDRPEHDPAVCGVCPICIGLRVLRQARPEVITHLSEAARQVSLALKALADAQADATEAATDDFEHIDLDDQR